MARTLDTSPASSSTAARSSSLVFLLVLPPLVMLLLFWLLTSPKPSTVEAKASEVEVSKSNAEGSDTTQKIATETAAAYKILDFSEVFVTPAGPQGLEYTDKIKALNGQLTAMTGYMVRNYGPDPAVFVFSDYPRIHNEIEEGLADSLPPSLLHVTMEVRPGDAPAWRSEKMTVYGRLEIGPHTELNGRISYLRLKCDFITDATTGNFLEVRMRVALQRERIGSTSSSDATTNGGSPIFFQPRRRTNQTPATTPSK